MKKNKGGFSWATFLGISAQKRKISKMIGVPLTKSGRKAKIGSWIMRILGG